VACCSLACLTVLTVSCTRRANEVVFALTTQDVRNECDTLLPVYRASDGQNGRVPMEVDPRSDISLSGRSCRYA